MKKIQVLQAAMAGVFKVSGKKIFFAQSPNDGLWYFYFYPEINEKLCHI